MNIIFVLVLALNNLSHWYSKSDGFVALCYQTHRFAQTEKRRGVDYITPQLSLIRSLGTSNIFDYNRTPVSMIICFFFLP